MATIPGGAYITDTQAGQVIHGTGFGDDIFLHFAHDTVYSGGGDNLVTRPGEMPPSIWEMATTSSLPTTVTTSSRAEVAPIS